MQNQPALGLTAVDGQLVGHVASVAAVAGLNQNGARALRRFALVQLLFHDSWILPV
jgi:hypothetical protein